MAIVYFLSFLVIIVPTLTQASPLTPHCQIANLESGDCLSCKAGYTLMSNTCVQLSFPNTNPVSTKNQVTHTNQFNSNGQSTNQLYNSNQGQSSGTQSGNFVPGYVQTHQPIVKTTSFTGQISQNNQNSIPAGLTTQQWMNILFYFYSQNPPQNNQNTNNPIYPSNPQPLPSGPTTSNYTDNNCKKINLNLQRCSQCYPSFYFNTTHHKCAPVNPLCKGYTQQNQCTSCYGGYKQENGNCVVDNSYKTPEQSDANCKRGGNGVCEECYKGFYFNSTQNKCVPVNPLCKGVTNSNQCLGCYPGYTHDPFAGTCTYEVKSQTQGTSTQNFNSQSNGQTNTNSQSSSTSTSTQNWSNILGSNAQLTLPNGNTIIRSNNFMVELNPQNQIVNIYPIQSFPQNNQQTVSNPPPSTYTPTSTQTQLQTQHSSSSGSSTSATSKCFYRQIIQNGNCVNVNDDCNTWDPSGKCTTCYSGYTVSGGLCVLSNN